MIPPPGEMDTRWQKIRKAMTRYQIGGVLFFSDQIHPEPIHYVANYTLMGEKAFCYLPQMEDPPVLFISETWDFSTAKATSGLMDIRIIGNNFYQEIAALNKKYGGPLGIAGRENLTRAECEAFDLSVGIETRSATRLLEEEARLKSSYELTLVREASKMADAGFEKGVAVIKEGLSDFELSAEINYVIRDMGATDNFQMLAVGKDNTGMLLPYGKKIEPGDLLLFEISPSIGSVTNSAQLCKTAFFGEKPSRTLKEKYAILAEALEESLMIIKPGVKMAEVTRIQDEILSNAGYGEYCKPPYMQQRGHGFGLSRVRLKKEDTGEFREGMSLVVHPNQFIPETGYLALGEHIIVTANGIERLTRTESKIYECIK